MRNNYIIKKSYYKTFNKNFKDKTISNINFKQKYTISLQLFFTFPPLIPIFPLFFFPARGALK